MIAGERLRFWVVGAAYFAVTLVFAYPFSLHMPSRMLSLDSDATLVQWIVAWDVHAFTHRPWNIFDANSFAPLADTLAFAENLIGSALLVAPIRWMTGNLALAMNLVTLVSIPLSGLGTYLLAKRLRVSEIGAILAGIVFAFSPSRFLRIEQFQLTTIQWVPFCLAYLHAYFDRDPADAVGRRRDLRIALAFFSLQAITAGHGATFLTVAVVGFLVYRFALGEPLMVRQRLSDVGVVGALMLVPTVLVYLPYQGARVHQGLVRNLDGWGTAVSSFFASPSHVDMAILARLPAWLSDQPDAYLFPGWVPLLLVLAAILPLRRRPAPVAVQPQRNNAAVFYSLLTIGCFWLTLGPPFGIWPLVYKWPVLSFIRVPTRFVLLELLGLAVLTGMAIDRLTRGARRNVRLTVATLCCTLALVEFAAMPLLGQPYDATLPAIARWLKSQPKPFTVAETPMPDPDNVDAANARNARFMLHSTAHWQKTVHGFSGLLPKQHEALYAALYHFPDDNSLRQLDALGVTLVVVHEDFTTDTQRAQTTATIAPFSAWLTFVHEEADGRVYALHRPGTTHQP